MIRECAPLAQDRTHRRYRHKNGIDGNKTGEESDKIERAVEGGAPRQVMKLKFGFVKVRTEDGRRRASGVCHLWVGQFIFQPKEAAVGDQRIDLLFPEVLHFADQKRTCSESP